MFPSSCEGDLLVTYQDPGPGYTCLTPNPPNPEPNHNPNLNICDLHRRDFRTTASWTLTCGTTWFYVELQNSLASVSKGEFGRNRRENLVRRTCGMWVGALGLREQGLNDVQTNSGWKHQTICRKTFLNFTHFGQFGTDACCQPWTGSTGLVLVPSHAGCNSTSTPSDGWWP